jgi:hypothetical protein
MRRNLQILVSLVLVISGTLVSAYCSGQLSVRSDCDNRYKAFIENLDKQGDLRLYFHDKGREDFYQTQVLPFRPSGRMYSGSNDSGIFIVGGAAVTLLGIAGIVDALRSRKQSQSK